MADQNIDPDVIAFMTEAAPEDVALTIEWLKSAGFNATNQIGGAGAPFGNAMVEWERRSLRIKIIRDRSQWMIDIAAPGLPFAHMAYLLTAKDGAPIVTTWEGPLPTQLPPDVTWVSTIPELVNWIESGERQFEIKIASDDWRSAMRTTFES
jgi:hypothetical protein